MEPEHVFLTTTGSIVSLCCYLGYKWWKSHDISRDCESEHTSQEKDRRGLISLDYRCTSLDFIDKVGNEEGTQEVEIYTSAQNTNGKKITVGDDSDSSTSRRTEVCIIISPKDISSSWSETEDGDAFDDGECLNTNGPLSQKNVGNFQNSQYEDEGSGYFSDFRDDRKRIRDRQQEWIPYRSFNPDGRDLKMLEAENMGSSRRRMRTFTPNHGRLRKSYWDRDRKITYGWEPYSETDFDNKESVLITPSRVESTPMPEPENMGSSRRRTKTFSARSWRLRKSYEERDMEIVRGWKPYSERDIGKKESVIFTPSPVKKRIKSRFTARRQMF